MMQNDFGLISIIMAAYNAEKTIEQAINSVLSQTYTDFELLVVNDCSKDRTVELVKDIVAKDSRVRLISNVKNSGVSYTRKHGLEEAKGDWIAILDSDDIHTYHGNWPDARWVNAEFFIKSFYFMPLYKRTIRNAEAVANVSIYMENFTKRYNSKSILIRNGMDFKPCEADRCYPKTYVMVGNIDTRKYKNAIRLAKYIYDIDPQVRINIYGKAIDKSVAKRLEKMPNVRLMGQHSIIPYGSYCGLINVSEIENLSISVCEAIKSDIPVFCFNIGGLPEVVKKDETGYTFPKRDYKRMAQKLVDYACDENKMRVDKSVLDPFDWNVAAKKYMTLLEEIMKDTTK